MKDKILSLILCALCVGACSALTTPPIPQVAAADVGPYRHLGVQHESTMRWREVLTLANNEMFQRGAVGIYGPKRARVVFADGGWVEFEPSPDSIKTHATPQILAIQFGRRT